MTGTEFDTAVLEFMDVDATRRGITTLRTAYKRAALADLAHYVDALNTGKVEYASDEVTPFDTQVAQAVAEYLKAKITRNVDRDLQLSQAHLADYQNVRRQLAIRTKESFEFVIQPWIGKQFSFVLDLRVKRLPLPIFANVWFTLKRERGDSAEDAILVLIRGDGIEVLDEDASQIRVTIPADITALLNFDHEYAWDVQVETDGQVPVLPVIYGIARPRLPVTDEFSPTLTTIAGEPLFTIGGIPISIIP